MTTTPHIGLGPGPTPKPVGWPLPRLFRGGQAPGGVEARTSDLMPPSFPAHFPLSALRGSTGGCEREDTSPRQGQRASATLHTWRGSARHSVRLSTPRRLTHRANGWTPGPNSACAAYTCESGFSLLYETRGPSPTLVHGGKGQGTPYHGAKSDKCGPRPPSLPLIKLGYAGGGTGLGG